MHIPDGFLTNRLAIPLDFVSALTVAYAGRRVRVGSSPKLIPIMGVLAAFIFAAQMLNFPVLGGTSGHLVGGALAAILLGPMAGFLTMATVIIAQALLLQDGGLIAAGANIFNLGAVATFAAHCCYRISTGAGFKGKRPTAAAFFAGWISVVLSAACCALELALSGAVTLAIALPAMVGYHALIGIPEGVLTAGTLCLLLRVRPDLLQPQSSARLGLMDWVGALVLVALPVAILVLGGSSRLPDPLQRMLPVAAGSGGSQVQALQSEHRYEDYLVRIALVLALALVFWVARVIQRGKHES